MKTVRGLFVIADLAHLCLQRAVIDQALLAQEVFQRAQKVGVVAVARLDPSVRVRFVGLANLNYQMAAELLPGARSRLGQPEGNRECARLPRSIERLPRVNRGIGEQFGKRAHRAPVGRGGGRLILAVPTIESRLTRPASSSSLMPLVPAGRCGITM